MLKKRLMMLSIGSFYLMGLTVFTPATPLAHANESMSSTVKIVAFEQMLNGELLAMAYGSGTFIDENGTVLTNAHVVMNPQNNRPMDAFSVCVSVDPKEEPECRFTANLDRYDEKIDLAVLTLNNKTAWGALPANFPYLEVNGSLEPSEGDVVKVYGFPSSGGITIHSTQGHVSGFEKHNGYTYLKTDADIDSGNSGGTMIDEEGHFIGIPSYVLSDLETSGRALHVSEIAPWLSSNEGKTGNTSQMTSEKLRYEWEVLYKAHTSGAHKYEPYPELSVVAPGNWTFNWIGQQSFFLSKDDDDKSYIQGTLGNNFFENNFTVEEKLAALRLVFSEEYFSNDEIIDIGDGYEAIHVWESNYNGAYHLLYVSHGYADLALEYFIPNNDDGESEAEVQTFLSTLRFNAVSQSSPISNQILNEGAYPFKISVPNDWHIEKSLKPTTGLASAQSNAEFFNNLDMAYWELPKGASHITPEAGLQYDHDYNIYYDEQVIFETTDLVVDGLPGWMYVSEYNIEGETFIVLSATLLDPEYELYFYYQADEEMAQKAVDDFLRILGQFKSKRYVQELSSDWDESFNSEGQGDYVLPHADSILYNQGKDNPMGDEGNALTDIEGHPYEQSIKNLLEMGVVEGFEDKTFRPDLSINRAASLKMILESLRVLQTQNNELVYQMPEDFNPFSDMDQDDWYATYVAEALDKEIINGYPDGTFRGTNTVRLGEALKMLLEAHDASVPSEASDPWYQKYFDLAQGLNLLNQNLQDPGKELTRGELAYLIDQLINQ